MHACMLCALSRLSAGSAHCACYLGKAGTFHVHARRCTHLCAQSRHMLQLRFRHLQGVSWTHGLGAGYLHQMRAILYQQVGQCSSSPEAAPCHTGIKH